MWHPMSHPYETWCSWRHLFRKVNKKTVLRWVKLHSPSETICSGFLLKKDVPPLKSNGKMWFSIWCHNFLNLSLKILKIQRQMLHDVSTCLKTSQDVLKCLKSIFAIKHAFKTTNKLNSVWHKSCICVRFLHRNRVKLSCETCCFSAEWLSPFAFSQFCLVMLPFKTCHNNWECQNMSIVWLSNCLRVICLTAKVRVILAWSSDVFKTTFLSQ